MIEDELKPAITATMHELKKSGVKGSYTPLQNLHLTLAFIGEVQDAAPVKNALKNVSIKPFRLSLSGMGNFDDVLYIGVKGNQGISKAANSVREALDAAGISYDRQSFIPHITIIRNTAGNGKKAKAPKGEMLVKHISLMRSEQKDGKTVYKEIMIR